MFSLLYIYLFSCVAANLLLLLVLLLLLLFGRCMYSLEIFEVDFSIRLKIGTLEYLRVYNHSLFSQTHIQFFTSASIKLLLFANYYLGFILNSCFFSDYLIYHSLTHGIFVENEIITHVAIDENRFMKFLSIPLKRKQFFKKDSNAHPTDSNTFNT